MRRPGWMLAGAVVLSLLPLTVSGCSITCGCAATADPNWTPAPVTAQEASIYAAKMAGRGTIDDPPMTAVPISGAYGRTFYEATTVNTLGLVDVASGFVVEVVLEDQMPSDSSVSASPSDARSAAETFVQRAGMDTEAFLESVQLIRQAGVAAYQVAWKDSGGTLADKFAVWVNASTGSVFAFVDLRIQLNLAAPIVSRATAIGLAIAALGVPGEMATSSDLTITFPLTGFQISSWDVGLGIPTATQPDVFEHGALVRVDAVSGETTIVKS